MKRLRTSSRIFKFNMVAVGVMAASLVVGGLVGWVFGVFQRPLRLARWLRTTDDTADTD